ncbi:hypothetical protein QCI42_21680 [Bacillus fungorum]|uniref:hypothetical protein n=1 Tax=Bacillus fungorum TaxID=2039284 RepID=UPI003398F8F0
MSQEISSLLTRYYVKLGMTAEEYIILNAYLNQTKTMYGKQNFQEISEMTDKTLDEVKSTFQSLFDKGLISKDPVYNTIDTLKLHFKLISLQNNVISINSMITSSIENYRCCPQPPHTQHMGQVTLLPLVDGGIAITQGTHSVYGGLMWPKQNMKKLADELLQFVENKDQNWIDKYNNFFKNTHQNNTSLEQHNKNI